MASQTPSPVYSQPPSSSFPGHLNSPHISHPNSLSFVGPLPTSIDQATHDFGVWNRSVNGCFPSVTILRGPGQAGPPTPPSNPPTTSSSRKQKKQSSTKPAAVGGFGPIVGRSESPTPPPTSSQLPSPPIDLKGRKNAAYDIWPFIRTLETDIIVPYEQWPADDELHQIARPKSKFIGCKLCTKFGNRFGAKLWTVFSNASTTSPTSTLRNHFRSVHNDIWETECLRLQIPIKTQVERDKHEIEPFTKEGLTARLTKFVVGDDQSINVVENPHFRELLLYLAQGKCTDEEIPRRTALTSSIIEAWMDERERFYQEMKKSVGRVSITADVWTDPNLTSYLGSTAHFIVRGDDAGCLILRSGLLAFRHVQGTHTGENLARILYEIINEAGIQCRIGSITMDNASNNDTLMKHLETRFQNDGIPFDHEGNRVRCFPHVINLAVQAIYAGFQDGKGLDMQYLLGGVGISEDDLKTAVFPNGVTAQTYAQALETDIVAVARKLVTACRASGKRREEFMNTIAEGNRDQIWRDGKGKPMVMEALQLLRDCETRWSSTFLMLDRLLSMLPVIKEFSTRPGIDIEHLVPGPAEVCILEHIRDIMGVPHLAQEALSSDRTPTLAFSLPFYYAIMDQWRAMKSEFPLLYPFISLGISKLEDYIQKSRSSRIYSLAILLNPCLKTEWIERNWSLAEAERAKTWAIDTMRAFRDADLGARSERGFAYTAAPDHSVGALASSAKRFLDRKRSISPTSTQSTTCSRHNSLPSAIDHNRILEKELTDYLSEDLFEPMTVKGDQNLMVYCDPLQYWKNSEKTFPHLFRLAMDILPAQASAVSCERLFSSSKETCTPRRNRISPMLMEALQALKFSFRTQALDLRHNRLPNILNDDAD